MNYMEIKKYDIANGKGIRVSLFVSGCDRKCPGCFNPETWSADAGKLYTKDTENEIIDILMTDYIQGLTLLGGEPLTPDKTENIWDLIRRVKRTLPYKDIWCYTGYLWEELKERSVYEDDLKCILSLIDILVDGPFIQKLSDKTLGFRGSSNQRIIRCAESIKQKSVLLDEELMKGI